MQVFKFGGLALIDDDSIRNAAKIIAKNIEKNLLVVVSATGKSTRLLCRYAEASYYKHDDRAKFFRIFRDNHYEILKGLSIDGEPFNRIARLIDEAAVVAANPCATYSCFFDEIISYGELVSSKILSAYLNKSGITNTWADIREILLTDNNYNAANIIFNRSREKVKKLAGHKLVITQGFIGRSEEGFTSTLGFEGSDYSATLLASFLEAEKVVIWKDVPGIMSADPRIEATARKLGSLSYEEAIEYAYAGAKVLHPKCIKPVQNKNIPLEIRSFLHPNNKGSIIQAKNGRHDQAVIIQNSNMSLVSICTKDFSFILENHLCKLFGILTNAGTAIQMLHHTAISVDICVEQENLNIDRIKDSLADNLLFRVRNGLSLLNIFNYSDQIIREKTRGKKILIENRAKNIYRVLFEPENDL
ncbi:MAG: aspartate kinase [Bacteroidota bacterium]|nr:aspartate kinase [Bacteroidota bacterium]